jgi:tetratricopeptide (TPR) repeat protein
VADIELRERFLGGGLVGHVESSPGLSWSDHNALKSVATASSEVARETSAIRRRLDLMGLDITTIGRAVMAVEAELGFGLQAVTGALSEQLTVLERIVDTLQTPAKTRAAERLVDVAELLRRERWQRALAISQTAIEDDPNNPAGFLAAAWAHMGLTDLERAREAFIEAAEAGDDVQRSAAGRQAARLTLALAEDPDPALKQLDRYGLTSAPAWPAEAQWDGPATRAQVAHWWGHQRELAATQYDRSVYLASSDPDESAVEISAAGTIDPRFFALAVTDTLLADHKNLTDLAARELERAHSEQLERLRSQVARLRALRARIADFAPKHALVGPAHAMEQEAMSALAEETIACPSRLMLHDLFIAALSRAEHTLEADEIADLQSAIEGHAQALASIHAGQLARPSERTVTIDGMTLRCWEVERIAGMMRPSRIWLISSDGIDPTTTELR